MESNLSSYPELMNISLRPVVKMIRRFVIRRKLAAVRLELDHINRQRRHDFHVERWLQGREAVLTSELHSL